MNSKLLKRLRNGFLAGVALALLTASLCAALGAREGDGPAIAVLAGLAGFVGMVMGIMPITGIPLPFVTHGGASLVSLAIGLGILQSINIRQTRAEW